MVSFDTFVVELVCLIANYRCMYLCKVSSIYEQVCSWEHWVGIVICLLKYLLLCDLCPKTNFQDLHIL